MNMFQNIYYIIIIMSQYKTMIKYETIYTILLILHNIATNTNSYTDLSIL